LVAFLFAAHPLRAESVAWVAERKDVLSGVFWMLTLWFWARYAERPSIRRYLAAAMSFSLGLLSKPMVVTLPFVLLLLDIWPLRRARSDQNGEKRNIFGARRATILFAEKLPLLALAAASSVLTMLAQRQVIGTFEAFPFSVRLGNALVSWLGYIRTTLLPACLSAFYPHPGSDLSPLHLVVASVILVAMTAIAIIQLRVRPWLAVGWFWYLGTLVPVIGLIQVGTQSMADRYTYLPQIGLWIMVAWTAAELITRYPHWRDAVVGAWIVLVMVLGFLTIRQVATWKDGLTVFSHAIECDDENWLAHANIAEILSDRGRHQEALSHSLRSLQINPANPVPHVNAGRALARMGRVQEAVGHYEAALEIDPNRLAALYNLGNAYELQKRHEQAAECYLRVLELDPGMTMARTRLGVQLLYLQRPLDAITVLCVEAAAKEPSLIFNCGLALATEGRLQEAILKFRAAIAIDPNHGASWKGLGNSLADLGRDDEAADALRRAAQLRPDDAQLDQRLAEILDKKRAQ
jgi:tetratricopeptide (TPR) repeat protein